MSQEPGLGVLSALVTGLWGFAEHITRLHGGFLAHLALLRRCKAHVGTQLLFCLLHQTWKDEIHTKYCPKKLVDIKRNVHWIYSLVLWFSDFVPNKPKQKQPCEYPHTAAWGKTPSWQDGGCCFPHFLVLGVVRASQISLAANNLQKGRKCSSAHPMVHVQGKITGPFFCSENFKGRKSQLAYGGEF